MSKKNNNNNSTSTSSKRSSKKAAAPAPEQKKERKARPANDMFRMRDALKLITANPVQTEEVLIDLNADKTLRMSEMHTLHARIAYRLAAIGTIVADTLARNAKDRTYKLKGGRKLTLAQIKTDLTRAQKAQAETSA